jgi:hypothetical protein
MFEGCLLQGHWGGYEILNVTGFNIIDPHDEDIVWIVKKVYRGRHRLQMRFTPIKDNDYYLLHHEALPFECEIEIRQGEKTSKRNIYFDINAGTLGRGIYLYEVPEDFKYKKNEDLQVIIKNISFPDELSDFYSRLSLWLERESLVPLM